ncbi:hypothetical protein K788_0003320 [Paraburkholderia caribensis MBA4]|uniref:Uncharacterized protein n=1 Tax=Paraburkholderia caribensis MBA4 TaxID=1323664 RepID=A0A0P0RCA7_9BURK|nr:hypothetical protein K788_0003320 [Paraburkholderia caribensis MBA4]
MRRFGIGHGVVSGISSKPARYIHTGRGAPGDRTIVQSLGRSCG